MTGLLPDRKEDNKNKIISPWSAYSHGHKHQYSNATLFTPVCDSNGAQWGKPVITVSLSACCLAKPDLPKICMWINGGEERKLVLNTQSTAALYQGECGLMRNGFERPVNRSIILGWLWINDCHNLVMSYLHTDKFCHVSSKNAVVCFDHCCFEHWQLTSFSIFLDASGNGDLLMGQLTP